MTAMPFNAGAQGSVRRGGKTPPPDETFEEAAYLKLLGEKQKAVSIKLTDGEVVRGWIEYYDRRSEEHTSELQSRLHLVCRLLLEKKKKNPRCRRGLLRNTLNLARVQRKHARDKRRVPRTSSMDNIR